MIFFLKSDGTLIKSAPKTVYQGSAEAGKVYVVAPLNANMLVDVYYELPNGERWGAYLLENNGTVINNEELPDGWALWSTTLESAITQYAGTLKAQFGFYQSGTADKVPLITSQGVTITIAKGVVRDLPSAPTADVYAQIVNAISSIKQDIANLPNEYLSNTNEDKIALKNNSAIEYSENATAGTIVKRDSNGKINVVDGTEDLNAVNVGQFNAALAGKVDASSVSSAAVKDTIAQRTATGQLKASDGVADDDLATVKQLNAVQGNYTDITNIDLNTGDTTVEYDTELGIKVNAKGTVTHKNGATEQPTTKFEVPIVSGDGIVIDKAQNEEKIIVKVDGKVTKTPNSIVKRDSAGRVKTADAVSDEDAASYGQQKALRNYTDSELLKKLDRTGGTITGNLIVSGNLSVSGETYVIESTTLKVADKLIYVAKDNISALTSPAGLITPKYDGTNDGGIVYDNSGTAYVGDIKLDSNGNVDVNNSDLQPIATRDNYSNFTNGHKVKVEVDSLQKSVKFVDGGKDDNFVKAFTIPNGASSGTLTADVKQKLCNPDGHNYYVFDDTSQMILKYSFNADDEIIQYKAIYLQNDKAYDITMQILPSNGSWRRSQTILNGATANPTLTGTETELTGLKVGGKDYKIPSGGFPTIKAGTGKFAEIFNYDAAHANEAIGNYSHAEGIYTYASNQSSHAEGDYCHATALSSHAEGTYTYATNEDSHAEGRYNINPMPADLIHATGIGTWGDPRDGFEVYRTGEVWCKGPLYVGGVNDSGNEIYQLDRTKAKEVATKNDIKLYQHTYTFEAGTNNYVYCTTYKNSNTPMTAAEVINFFKSDPSVGKVVNVCVVNNGTTVGSGYFFDAGEGIDYTVIVLNSSADFTINADTNMTPNIIEL